jgi:hypothetical protein
MRARQFILPFRRNRSRPPRDANRDLIGRSYRQDKYVRVTVIDVCRDNPARVVLERNLDANRWTMPGWLVRLILLEEEGKRAA